MITRGSLKKCIACLIYEYNNGGHTQLSIIHCPRGKYYFVLTEPQLEEYNRRSKSDEMRLLFRGTERELARFAQEVPPTLFDEKETNEGT